MIAPENTALILLAAGKSVRFGSSDKLMADFLGQPLGMHVVTALDQVPFASRIVVTDGVPLDYAARGYRVVRNPRPKDGMSLSIRLGVAAARGPESHGAIEAVVIALADMPRVTAAQIYRLFDAQHGPETVVASSDGLRPRPPVLFGSGRFDALETLTGDSGARDMILAGRHVIASPEELVDVDTQEELEALRARFEKRLSL